MSPILSSIVTAVGGVLAGLALAAGLLWHQQQALTRARHAADHDDTTGLPNRRALLAAADRAAQRGTPFGLVLIDLDGFKAINDTFGHEAGNDVLTDIGRRLAALPGPVWLAARLSGDEFALLVDGGPDEVAAAARAAWRTVGRHPVDLGAHTVAVRASVGHTTAALGVSPRTLLHHADMAMYQAKQSGAGVYGTTTTTAHTGVPPGTRLRDLRRHR
ncbi:GGDEF domain-containing protein [Micromonospora maris]|uniref:Diguanylate cyclase n=1 Tax=Micromonospora maris TaxID=1003110 RepID=A0A9X0LF96_9ACTN|nr:GGDEF domain-containing protein [Micromonospora maris]AEB42635.1 diguanylate cyclase [Micromonospora maris AB-18-032]KUJ48076.1 diguanylate cyclase [Micromonospora maris]